MKVEWVETTEEKYDYALGVVPPEVLRGSDFLQGEPVDHRPCQIRGGLARVFDAYVIREGKFYVASEALTISEFTEAVKTAPAPLP
jgi:hypothetical protein